MKCLKIQHPRLIYSIFAFLFFSFFLSFGLSQDSYATSGTCPDITYNFSSAGMSRVTISSTYCRPSVFSLDYPVYVRVTISQIALTVPGSADFYVAFNPFHYNFYNNGQSAVFSTNSLSSDSIVLDYYFESSSAVSSWNIASHVYGRSTSQYKFVIELSDSPFSSGSDPEPCPVCPEIPENPYDNKFDNITKAIYVCGAILIMLYFFFCIYKIIVKDGGSR